MAIAGFDGEKDDPIKRSWEVAMLVGARALGATDEVTAVALRLHAGVAKALLGKSATAPRRCACSCRSCASAPTGAGRRA